MVEGHLALVEEVTEVGLELLARLVPEPWPPPEPDRCLPFPLPRLQLLAQRRPARTWRPDPSSAPSITNPSGFTPGRRRDRGQRRGPVPVVQRLLRASGQVRHRLKQDRRAVPALPSGRRSACWPRNCWGAAPARPRPRPLRRLRVQVVRPGTLTCREGERADAGEVEQERRGQVGGVELVACSTGSRSPGHDAEVLGRAGRAPPTGTCPTMNGESRSVVASLSALAVAFMYPNRSSSAYWRGRRR